jgi:dimethylargininase
MIAFVSETILMPGKSDVAHPLPGSTELHQAQKEHAAFRTILGELGAKVVLLKQRTEIPIGETCVLLPEIAIFGRSGNSSWDLELESTRGILGRYRPVQSILTPGTLNAGDVLQIGKTLFVAETKRTNPDGIAALRESVSPFGYELCTVEVHDGVRLRSVSSFVPPHFLVFNSRLVNPNSFGDCVEVHVDENEPDGANTLTVGTTTLINASSLRTEKRLQDVGINTRGIEISQLAKTYGGLSGLCLLQKPRGSGREVTSGGSRDVAIRSIPSEEGHVSQAVVHRGLVYVSPQSAKESAPRSGKRMPVEKQAEESLRQVSLVLNAAGSSLSRVVRATIHLADPKHLERVDPAYAKAFGSHRPARAVVANGALPPGVAVAIEVVAAATEDALAAR